jgi:hypothetical protein
MNPQATRHIVPPQARGYSDRSNRERRESRHIQRSHRGGSYRARGSRARASQRVREPSRPGEVVEPVEDLDGSVRDRRRQPEGGGHAPPPVRTRAVNLVFARSLLNTWRTPCQRCCFARKAGRRVPAFARARVPECRSASRRRRRRRSQPGERSSAPEDARVSPSETLSRIERGGVERSHRARRTARRPAALRLSWQPVRHGVGSA